MSKITLEKKVIDGKEVFNFCRNGKPIHRNQFYCGDAEGMVSALLKYWVDEKWSLMEEEKFVENASDIDKIVELSNFHESILYDYDIKKVNNEPVFIYMICVDDIDYGDRDLSQETSPDISKEEIETMLDIIKETAFSSFVVDNFIK